MSRPTPHQIRLLADQLRATPWAELHARLEHLLTLDANGGGTTNDGWSAAAGSNCHGGDINRPTENAAINRALGVAEHDELREHLEQAVGYLAQAAASAGAFAHRLDAAEALAQPEPRADPAGTCNACDRWVAGTPDDRLRSGYCDACRKAWERAGYPDRAAFERGRNDGSPDGGTTAA